MQHVFRFVHELTDAPTQFSGVSGLKILNRTVFGAASVLAPLEANVWIGVNGDDAESVAPAGGENLPFRHAPQPVDDQQRRLTYEGINGVGETHSKDVVTVGSPQFHRDAAKDTRVTLEPSSKDFFAHHVPHGTDGKSERFGYFCEFALATRREATDGQNTDHDRPYGRGAMKGATRSVLERLLSPPHVDERPKDRRADQQTARKRQDAKVSAPHHLKVVGRRGGA